MNTPSVCGVDLIAAERQRQIDAEGWTPEHDDEHDNGDLIRAAVAYAIVPLRDGCSTTADSCGFPDDWHASWWKPSDDPIRNLVKAGALIAAEIDRLQRAQVASSGVSDE